MNDDFPLVAALASIAMLRMRKGQERAANAETPTEEDYRRKQRARERKLAEEQREREEMERSPRAYRRRMMKVLSQSKGESPE
jgi:hypothetical protein